MSRKTIPRETEKPKKLTRAQKKEIDAVLRKYKGDGKPRTAQATIPYEAIYPDGVCRMPAFASGSDPAPEPLPEIIEEEPTTGGMEPEGVPITPKGNAALVDDFYGDKQLITVTTKAGNYFYILIDRANEDKKNSVHFLNQVDDADLLALLDEEPQDTEVCTCTVKCEAGNVNENCPLCEKSLRNCTAPEAVKTDTETPQEKPKSSMGSLIILLVLALAGGGAALYYFKFRKPKTDTTGHDDLD